LIDTKQEAPAASELPQLVVCGNKLAPVPVIPNVKAIVVEPVLVKTTAWPAVVVGATTVPKLIVGPDGGVVPGCKLMVPSDAEAAPVKFVDAGVTTALPFTFNAAKKVPAVAEVKVTVIEQFAPMANVVPQVVPVTEKSLALAPVIVVPVIFIGAVPVLVSVAVCDWLDAVRELKLSEEVSDASNVAPGLSPMKEVPTMDAMGVTTGAAAPAR
jgi:hypothetical protein